jgi:hypothetical protein
MVQVLDFNTLPQAVSKILAQLEDIGHEVQCLKSLQEDKISKRFMSPEETCGLFYPKISLPTLNAWAKKGFLKKHYIGAKTYYRYDEVMQAVKSLKKYNRQP